LLTIFLAQIRLQEQDALVVVVAFTSRQLVRFGRRLAGKEA
jgi:hypothetical protein